jgi:XapX domain-containing protein
MKIAVGILLALGIGAICRVVGIPVPAPPAIVGSLLVLSMTTGYLIVDRYTKRPAANKHLCGVPSGNTVASQEQRR